MLVPVVVNKDYQTWIEWKKFVAVNVNGGTYSIGISLRYLPWKRQWNIQCIDYDATRIFEQHRLISDFLNTDHLKQYQWANSDIIGRVTTRLNIVEGVSEQRKVNR